MSREEGGGVADGVKILLLLSPHSRTCSRTRNMHVRRSHPYSTVQKAFRERLGHSCCRGSRQGLVTAPRRCCPGNHAVGMLCCGVMQKRARRRRRGGAAADASVWLTQANSSSNGGHQDGAAGQDPRGPGVEDQAAVQGLDRSEGTHHRLPVMELELGESLQLSEKVKAAFSCRFKQRRRPLGVALC